MSKSKILFNLTGSIACYKACDLISKLVQANFEVKCVVSKSALNFIGESTLEGLTGQPVQKDMYQAGDQMSHISLARWADLILVCPASANAINKFAAGISDDLVSSLFLANNFKKPYWIAPAMNTEMFNHPATQKSLKQLSDWGAKIISSKPGNLACGETGDGRLVEPIELLSDIKNFFKGSGS